MALSDAQFQSLSARIAETVGIHIATEKRWLLSARVKERLESTGDADEKRYVERVLDAGGAEELGHLVEALRVGETQFYRHASQLRAIERVALPEILARRQRDGTKMIKVWSAGCASGEEPYTLAMLLDAFLGRSRSMSFEILATDLSNHALGAAKEARYPAGAIRGVPDEVAESAFTLEGDDIVVRPHLRAHVRFQRRNLLAAPYPLGFDLVLCRNVLIYFGRATQHEVLRRLARSVVPGGYLALGYTERLDAGDGELLPLRTDDGVLYRRADGATRVVLPTETGQLKQPRRPSRPPGKKAPSYVADKPPKRRRSRAKADGEPSGGSEPVVRSTGTRTGTGNGERGRGPEDADARESRPSLIPLKAGVAPRLTGTLEGAEGARLVRKAVAPLVAGEVRPPVLSLEGLAFADSEALRTLSRAAAAIAAHGIPLTIEGASAGVRHILKRNRVVPPAVIADPGEE